MPVGRPTKYEEHYAEQARKLCLLGATDVELADFFEVAESTISEWKLKQPSFSEAIKNGKTIADTNVAEKLYNRATGATIVVQQAIKLTTKTPNAQGKMLQEERVEIVELQQEVPPDTTAAIFWLKNRSKQHWRDKVETDVRVVEDEDVILPGDEE